MDTDRLSLTLGALADPTRRAILAQLARGAASVGELAEPHEMSLAAVSKHIKVLERAGLVTRGKSAQWRPCALNPEPLREIDSWLAAYRQLWDDSLHRLEEYLAKLQRPDPDGSTH